MITRRAFAATALAAPAVLKGAARPWAEIEKILASGNVKGRLSKDELPTPALLLDLDLFEANVRKMTAHARNAKRGLRPHGKTHKCPEIAKYLVSQGAVGACGAKLSEGEVFARHGVRGLLITTAVIGKHKIERALRLAAQAPDTTFVVDNAQNASDLNEAALAARRRLNVAIDLNVSGRTGITPGEPAVALAEQIARLPGLKLKGIQAYAGGASHTKGFEARKKASIAAMTPAVETRHEISKRGIECNWLSGGSTGTYNIDSTIEGITELQPGSFLFMDIDYNRIGGQSGDVYQDFGNSLTVLATVVSRPTDAHVIVDAGLKAFSTDKPFPPEAKMAGITYAFAGDEHGRLTFQGRAPLQVGDRAEFVIPHCDPTVNLHDRIYGTRGQQVETVWAVAARGMSQ